MKRVLFIPVFLLIGSLFNQGLMAQSCPPPTAVNTNIDSGSLLLDISVDGPDSLWVQCEYQVRAVGDISWKKARRAPGPFSVNMASNLDPSTVYDLRVRCACSISPLEVSPFGPPTSFTTTDLPTERIAMDSKQINLYPNPAISMTTVNYQSDMDADIELYVLDITGKVVYQQTTSVTAGVNNLQLDLSTLNPGMYFFRATAGNTEYRESLQIIR